MLEKNYTYSIFYFGKSRTLIGLENLDYCFVSIILSNLFLKYISKIAVDVLYKIRIKWRLKFIIPVDAEILGLLFLYPFLCFSMYSICSNYKVRDMYVISSNH